MPTQNGWTSTAPPDEIVAITASDTALVSGGVVRAIWVGAQGKVVVVPVNGPAMQLPAVTPGMWHVMAVKQIRKTGTDAAVIAAGIFGGR